MPPFDFIYLKQAIQEVNTSELEIESKKDALTQILQNLSAISQENAAGSEEASASVEEQTAAMAEIANSSEELFSPFSSIVSIPQTLIIVLLFFWQLA